MPFLKVLPEKEEEQVKFIEVSPVYEPVIDSVQENEPIQESPVTEPESITPPEESPAIEEDTPITQDEPNEPITQESQDDSEQPEESPEPVDDINIIDETAQETTQENTPESEQITPPEESPVIKDKEDTPITQEESESEQDDTPAPVDETANEPTTPEESPEESTQDNPPVPDSEPTTPPEEPTPAPAPEPEPIDPNKKYTGGDIKYDVTSGKRYVDLVSTKTDFDRMLDELAAISKDIIEHEADRFAKKYTGKFQGGFDKAEADAKKYDAFLGGYITNAAMLLYDRGHREVAISKLEETRKVLEARKRLEDETAAIKTRVEEEDAVVDLSDILGLFGDG